MNLEHLGCRSHALTGRVAHLPLLSPRDHVMRRRAFFFASVFWVIVALSLHIAALGQISKGVGLRAQSVRLAAEQKQQMNAGARRYTSRGEALSYVGLVFGISSVGCLVVSFRRHEAARRSIPVTLLICYLMLQFMLV